MKRNCLILTALVVSCALFLQIGCREQDSVTGESKPELTAPKSAIGPAKAETVPEANEPAPERVHPASPPAKEAQNGDPQITFEKAIHDFGEVGPGEKKSCEFKFTNTGAGLLKIKRIQSTCGCTVPKLSKKEYTPGESGSIKVIFTPPKHQGTIGRRLYIHSNDKKNPKAALIVKANVVMKVDHEPKRLNLSLREENAGCPEITLTSLDNQPFAIKRFKSTGNSITADIDSSVKATKFVLEAKVDIEKLRKALKGRIEISLTHPECKAVTIPFNALPEFKINPPSIIVFNAESQKPVTKEVWILNNYDKEFEVESASSKKGIIKVLGLEKKDNRYKFDLQITPPVEGKSRIFTDVFYVNIKDGEKLEITCRGFYTKNKKSR